MKVKKVNGEGGQKKKKKNCTISTEALGKSRGVGDVKGRVLLWHQGDH